MCSFLLWIAIALIAVGGSAASGASLSSRVYYTDSEHSSTSVRWWWESTPGSLQRYSYESGTWQLVEQIPAPHPCTYVIGAEGTPNTVACLHVKSVTNGDAELSVRVCASPTSCTWNGGSISLGKAEWLYTFSPHVPFVVDPGGGSFQGYELLLEPRLGAVSWVHENGHWKVVFRDSETRSKFYHPPRWIGAIDYRGTRWTGRAIRSDVFLRGDRGQQVKISFPDTCSPIGLRAESDRGRTGRGVILGLCWIQLEDGDEVTELRALRFSMLSRKSGAPSFEVRREKSLGILPERLFGVWGRTDRITVTISPRRMGSLVAVAYADEKIVLHARWKGHNWRSQRRDSASFFPMLAGYQNYWLAN